MIQPRLALGGLLALFVALAGAACGGLVNPQGWASPVLEGSDAYVFLDRDRLSAVAIDGGSGRVAWEFPNDDIPDQEGINIEANYGTPVIDGDILYFAGFEDGLFAIERESGELVWRFDSVSGSVIGGPLLLDGVLYFGTTEGHVYAVNAEDGTARDGWPGSGLQVDGQVYSAPISDGERVYVATMEGEVGWFDPAASQPEWTTLFTAGGAVPVITLVNDTTIFVPSFNRRVYLVDTQSGTALPAGGLGTSNWVWMTPAFDDSNVYFGDLSGNVYSLDITTGEESWGARHRADSPVKAGPAIIGDTLVVLDRGPVISFLDRSDGRLLATFPLDDVGTIRADPATAEDGEVYFITTNGRLFRVDADAMRAVEVDIEELPE